MPKTALRGGERRVSPRFRAVAQEHDAPTQEAEARQPACGAQERRESPAGVMSTMSTGAQRVQDAMLPHAERADHNQRPFGGDPAKVSIRRDAGSNRKTRIIVAPVVLRRCPHPRRRQLAAVAPRRARRETATKVGEGGSSRAKWATVIVWATYEPTHLRLPSSAASAIATIASSHHGGSCVM